ncbi:MAG: alpha/beta hydrolase [Clostridium sp.]|nr:alpha/beta hydrolase [Clostridium sp.]
MAAAGAAGVIATAQIAEAAYFYRRTMKRGKAKTERTIKMAGTDWSRHMPFIGERKEYMLAQPHEDVYCQSFDGLKLHGVYFPNEKSKKLVICFHGYTSEGMKDYIGLSGYYLHNGYAMLLVDERAHGQSEGDYIGFGCLDRQDALQWIAWVIETCGEDVEILLHGTSMGGATVLMASGLKLPGQVKGIVSDCGFTSPKEVFTHVLHSMYHLPAFPLMQIADYVNRKKAGYGMDECNAAREVQKAVVPILMIHGDADTFVPCSMCEEIYNNCSAPKKKLIVAGAAHAESYYIDTAAYENALDEFRKEIEM